MKSGRQACGVSSKMWRILENEIGTIDEGKAALGMSGVRSSTRPPRVRPTRPLSVDALFEYSSWLSVVASRIVNELTETETSLLIAAQEPRSCEGANRVEYERTKRYCLYKVLENSVLWLTFGEAMRSWNRSPQVSVNSYYRTFHYLGVFEAAPVAVASYRRLRVPTASSVFGRLALFQVSQEGTTEMGKAGAMRSSSCFMREAVKLSTESAEPVNRESEKEGGGRGSRVSVRQNRVVNRHRSGTDDAEVAESEGVLATSPWEVLASPVEQTLSLDLSLPLHPNAGTSKMNRKWIFLFLCALIICSCAFAQNQSGVNITDSDDMSFDEDPILKYRPDFSRSLPVQILITGIVLTLTSVLLLHLLFTAQYHWPLAPVNFALQISAVFTLLISLIATLQVILSTATKESRTWPYMLNYIAVDIPPLNEIDGESTWTDGEQAAWSLMNATTSALIQITHIQFLTLLFPSSLEKRLIFSLLGPLALVSAVMQLLPLKDLHDSKLASITAAVQNVCNATLSLLFTVSLLLWGFFVNRKKAWRTDGGTAAFGAGAITLALASTAITFIYIPHKDQYDWLPGLMWAVILWQSFLETERTEREAQREERKAETFLKGLTGALGFEGKKRVVVLESDEEGRLHPVEDDHEHEDSLDRRSSRRRRGSDESGRASIADSTRRSTGFFARIANHRATRVLYGWYQLLRHAHFTAAQEQAVENVEKINQVYGGENRDNRDPDPGVVGWGLGSFGIRQRGAEIREGEERARVVTSDDEVGSGSEDEAADRGSDGSSGDMRRRKRRKDIQPNEERRRSRRDMREREQDRQPQMNDDGEHRSSSMWWWGPLRRWRLQDSTVYS
ncbi:hypothetical protein NLI96_g3462 [Meripilus lineatus]|uniref:Uncharacterized protein n=1 Tax=Meripilus lineatus TaxID=2056292 RepID=A0AAD5V6Q8_9APHY|nr:hypothetical protein NLI96_g3462 [Physisporinus lineatus]